jgi:hypothetical protein
VAWLTPVEIFKPWYGYALAKYILEYHRHVLQESGPLTIYEVGGGTGTLATCVLVGPSSDQQARAVTCGRRGRRGAVRALNDCVLMHRISPPLLHGILFVLRPRRRCIWMARRR